MATRPLLSRTAAALASAALMLALAMAPSRRAHAEIVDRVVAVIEDDAIFLSELERRMGPVNRQLEQIPNPRQRAEERERLYRETLERMVDDALVRKAAARAHLTVTDQDVLRMVTGIAQQRGGTAEDLYTALESEGVTRAEYREVIEAEVLRLRLMNVRVRGRVRVSDAEVAEEYRRRVRVLTDRVPFHAAHIFLAFPENPTAAQVSATADRAAAIARRLAAGEDFAALARTASDDPSTRESGGDLGAINPADTDPAPPPWMISAVRELRPGQNSAVVRGANGYHIFRLLERDEVALPSLAESHDELYNFLLNQEMARQQRAYLRELRGRSAVQIRL